MTDEERADWLMVRALARSVIRLFDLHGIKPTTPEAAHEWGECYLFAQWVLEIADRHLRADL